MKSDTCSAKKTAQSWNSVKSKCGFRDLLQQTLKIIKRKNDHSFVYYAVFVNIEQHDLVKYCWKAIFLVVLSMFPLSLSLNCDHSLFSWTKSFLHDFFGSVVNRFCWKKKLANKVFFDKVLKGAKRLLRVGKKKTEMILLFAQIWYAMTENFWQDWGNLLFWEETTHLSFEQDVPTPKRFPFSPQETTEIVQSEYSPKTTNGCSPVSNG